MISKSVEEMNKEETKMDMTPMIDVTFQLLIFFMCTLHFSTAEGILSSNLPKDVGINNVPVKTNPTDAIKVTVQNDVIVVGDTSYTDNDFPRLESEIEENVTRLSPSTEKIPYDLIIGEKVPFHRLIKAMNVAHKINNNNHRAKLVISISN